MKKFTGIFLIFALVLCLSLTALAADNEPQLCSGYYGIDRQNGLIGQIAPGTDRETLLSRILPIGDLQLDRKVATGSQVTLSQGGTVVDQLSLVVLSDCSGDGVFSVSDMLMVKSRLLNQRKFSAAQAQAADVNGDNAVTITDFLQMKSKVLGLTDFSVRTLPNGIVENSRILALGESCSFGPADGVLGSPAAAEEPEATTGETAEPSTEETTEPSTEETTEESSEPSTEPSEPAAIPVITVEGDAVTWEAGTVTAVKLGTARISYQEESLLITVCKEGLKLSLPKTALLVAPGAKMQLQISLNHPVDPSAITYSVADTAIAKVDAKGVITGVATGTTKVTATLPGGVSATQDVRVIRLIDKLTLNDDYIKVKPGGSKQLTATVSPKESPEKLIWTSSNPSIATVDATGQVTGKAKGTVTVTCTTEQGKLAARCKVKVCDLIQVALTFDDGPSAQYTGKLLDALKKYDVDATFFLVGNRISTSPSSVKRMAQEGHEIGYHTWAHSYFYNMSAAAMKSDLEKFQNTVKSISGSQATVYRAPGGGITSTALATYKLPHIMWNVDTRDWETLNSWSVRNAIIGGLKDGNIILLHDIHGSTYNGTVSALEYIFSKDMDVEFLTVTELLSRKGTPPKNGVTYYSGR